MTNQNIYQALNNIDPRLIASCIPSEPPQKTKSRRSHLIKWASIAACLMLLIGIGIIALPKLLDQAVIPDDHASQPDDNPAFIYAVKIGDFIYSPFYSTDYERFPEVHHLIKNAPSGSTTYIEFDIKDAHFGEYIGIVPANKKAHRSEGKAYRLAEYPNYDGIIIVDFDGKYELYVGAANDVDTEMRANSSNLLDLYYLPESATSMYIYNGNDSEKIYIDESVYNEFFTIIDDKEGVDYKTINDIQWQAWCKEKGAADTGVSYDGEEFKYSNHEAREAYVEFVNRNISSLWIETNRGFKDIYITFLPDFQYVDIAGGWYLLDDAETARIAELLGVTKNN